MSEAALEVSDDALKLLVAEHGVRGTARLLGMDERQTHAFRQRATRGKWLHEPGMVALRERTMIAPANVAKPIVAAVSPAQAIAAEISQLGSKTRLSLARGIAKAGEHIERMDGQKIVLDAQNVKAIAQTASTVHSWDKSVTAPKIRLELLSSKNEGAAIEIEAEPVTTEWDEMDEY